MSLLPNVERELMRVARASAGGSLAAGGPVRGTGARRRLSGAMLAFAVSAVALLIAAGFLVALRGANAGGGAPATTPSTPPASHGAFPGAPHQSRGHFTKQGMYVCRRAARNRYLPRNAGCVSVLRADMAGGLPTDLVLLYADLAGRRMRGDFFEAKRFMLEVVQPGGKIARTRVQSEPFPWITRVGNINGVPGDELVVHLDDISSGDTYGIYTFRTGRIELVRPLLSAGGDSAAKEGFFCKVAAGGRPVVVSRTMTLLGPTIDGRWRWTMKMYAFHGARLYLIQQGSFTRRGLPRHRDTPVGAGCGRSTGATQTNP